MNEWRDFARCVETDPEAFFPDKGGQPYPAKRVCLGCEVRTDCLEYAMDNPVMGVWGGTTLKERQERARAEGRAYLTSAPSATEQRRDDLIRYYRQGWTDQQIADRMRVSERVIRGDRKALGLPRQERWSA